MVTIGAPTQRTHNIISQWRYYAICVHYIAICVHYIAICVHYIAICVPYIAICVHYIATPCALHYGLATVSRID